MTSAAFIRTGGMRHYADLQSKETSPDGGGGEDVTWVTDRKIWVQIRPISGAQRLEGMRRESSVTHEIYTRHQDDVDPSIMTTKRILHGAVAYNISAAFMPKELPEFVQMFAERGVAT